MDQVLLIIHTLNNVKITYNLVNKVNTYRVDRSVQITCGEQ